MTKTYLTIEDVRKLVDAATLERDRLVVLLLSQTGVRVSELVGLKVGDIGQDTLTIRHLKSRGEKYRQVPVSPYLAKALHSFCNGVAGDNRVFPITRIRVQGILRTLAERAGLQGKVLTHPNTGKKHYISPHRLRDALAVNWLRVRGDLEGQKALQDMLGHASFSTTARYFKLGMDDVRKVYQDVMANVV